MTGMIVALIAGFVLGGLGGVYGCWRLFSERWWDSGFDAGLLSVMDNEEVEDSMWQSEFFYNADSEWVEIGDYDDHGEVA